VTDDEIYEYAQDELNSDRRKPDLWKRARSLAQGDQDEARFLYQNMRTAELLELYKQGKPFISDTDSDVDLNDDSDAIGHYASNLEDQPPADGPAQSESQRLIVEDPLDDDEDETEIAAIRAFSNDESLSFEQMSQAHVDGTAAVSDTVMMNTIGVDDLDSSLDMNDHVLEHSDDPTLDLSSAEGSLLDETLDPTTDFGYKPSTEISDSSADDPAMRSGAFQALADDVGNLTQRSASGHPFNDHVANNRADDVLQPAADPNDAATANLDRQADAWLPNTTTTGSASAIPAADTSPAFAGHGVAVAGAATAGAAAARSTTKSIAPDYSSPSTGAVLDDLTTPKRASLDQTELLSGRGRLYRVFSRGPHDTRAVRRGVSWTAMFFTLPWLLFKRMPGTAIIYAALWLFLAAALIATGVTWLDAGPNAPQILAWWTWAFVALAVVALLLAPFFLANRWYAASLRGRGYEELATVRAPHPHFAIHRVVKPAM